VQDDIGTTMRMREWQGRMDAERQRDEYYQEPCRRLGLLEHLYGKGFLADAKPASESIQ